MRGCDVKDAFNVGGVDEILIIFLHHHSMLCCITLSQCSTCIICVTVITLCKQEMRSMERVPNVVAFHTPLSKYLTVIVTTLN